MVLVEGESDCHTLWHHGVEALGIPGASNFKEEWAEHLQDIEKLYAVVEPDEGGAALWERLAASTLREKLHRVELEGAKDPSELHLQDPDHFKENLRKAVKAARRWAEEVRLEEEARDRRAWQACEQLAREDRILDRFARTLEQSGVAGESRVLKLLYLALTSRLLEKPVSVAVKGPSSGGKSYLTARVSALFPRERLPRFDRHERTHPRLLRGAHKAPLPRDLRGRGDGKRLRDLPDALASLGRSGALRDGREHQERDQAPPHRT